MIKFYKRLDCLESVALAIGPLATRKQLDSLSTIHEAVIQTVIEIVKVKRTDG